MIAISRLIIPALEPERRRASGDIPLRVSRRGPDGGSRGKRSRRRRCPGPFQVQIPRRYGSALRFPALNAKVDLWV
jgi:hypothetical protein